MLSELMILIYFATNPRKRVLELLLYDKEVSFNAQDLGQQKPSKLPSIMEFGKGFCLETILLRQLVRNEYALVEKAFSLVSCIPIALRRALGK